MTSVNSTRSEVKEPSVKTGEKRFEGTPVSAGVAIGQVICVQSDHLEIDDRIIEPDEIDSEIEKLQRAHRRAVDELAAQKEEVAASLGEESAKILETHLLLLEDVTVRDEALRAIRERRLNASRAIHEVITLYAERLKTFELEHMRERSVDLRDVRNRWLNHLLGTPANAFYKLEQPSIIFAHELTPSHTVNLDREKVLGFATDLGGRTSHAVIMARALKVPAVVGLRHASTQLKNGDPVILDGHEGLLILRPGKRMRKKYGKLSGDYQLITEKLARITPLPARTRDGKDIELSANIEFPEEVESLRDLGGYGVGLYRTEYLYLARPELPSEEEQYRDYVRIIKRLEGQPIIIRTFDLGGDKTPSSMSLPYEENPFLGLRGIRLYRGDQEAQFRTQLRAILRASVHGHVRIMFPMIACLSDIRYCRRVMQEVMAELSDSGITYAGEIPVGVMIEVPSAAVIADMLAQECDFLSIGTNDLVQYTLAVDRGNEHIAYLNQSFHPSILRLIRDVIQKGHRAGVWVGMCGEMSSDPLATMILLGLGIDEFSISPVALPLIKEIIRRVEFSECENLAEKALCCRTGGEVEEYLNRVMHKKFKDLLLLLPEERARKR